MTAWNTVLDEIERDLAAMEAALDDRASTTAPAERIPPSPESQASEGALPAGPLPDELVPRAEVLLARTRSLEARAAIDRDRIGASLLTLAGRRHTPEPARTGRLVDFAG